MRDAESMRTTLDIDDDILAAVKEFATQRNQSADKAISHLLRITLSQAHPVEIRNGIRLIPRTVNAPITTMAEVDRLMEEP